MTQECAADADLATVVSFDEQARGPFPKREARQSGNNYEVDDRHENGEEDPGSFGGVTGCTRAATQHLRGERTENHERNECDVVDQQSTATERKRGSESLTAVPGGTASCLGAGQTLG